MARASRYFRMTPMATRFSTANPPEPPLICDSAPSARTKISPSFPSAPAPAAAAIPTEFGLVREAGGWRIISVGILLFDVSQLAQRWEQQDLENHEIKAANALYDLANAIEHYHDAFGRMPEGLAELGPAPPNEVSPEQANLIEGDLAGGTRDGYRYQYRVLSDNDGNPTGFELTATPEPYAKSGKRSFLLDAERVLHGADKRGDMATKEDPVISAKTEQ